MGLLEIDKDATLAGDGKLSRQEFLAAFRGLKLDASLNDSLEQLFAQFTSLDGGQTLHFTDFLAASMANDYATEDAHLRAAFRFFDHNNDGPMASQAV